MKKILIALILAAVMVLLSGCVGQDSGRPMMAKIRYFDGSTDTIQITKYLIIDGFVRFETDRGWKILAGANNVIIIDGDDGQDE